MTKRLYCLGVLPLYQTMAEHHKNEGMHPIPSFCLCDFNDTLVAQIKELHKIIIEHRLSAVSIKITTVTWFLKQTNRYHVSIPTILHISESHVHFTGCLPPYNQAYFQSFAIPLTEVWETVGTFKEIDLARITLPLAKGLINELQAKQADLDKLSDRYHALEPVLSALVSLDETAEPLITNTKVYEEALSSEIATLSKQTETLEVHLDSLTKQFLHRLFDIGPGDWICAYTSPRPHKPTKLKVEHVWYYNGSITISGLIITQKGEVGKRQGSIYLQIGPDNEH